MSGEIEAASAQGACLNCGAQLTGHYCANCGQAADTERTLAHMFEEALHGILHFDSKIWLTLPMLIGRPGTLTRNYVFGHRARYISPFALFLFCIFLMYFTFAFVRLPTTTNIVAERPEVQAQMQAEAQAAFGESGTWQEALRHALHSGGLIIDTGSPELDARLTHAAENPDLSLYKIHTAAYKFSFLLLPISLPFIWLLFAWKRGVTLYDHAAYALYDLSFASLLFISATLTMLTPWTSWATVWLVLIGLPVHTYFHLKGAYALSWFSALWRSVFMLIFAVICLLLFNAAIFVVGLVG